MADDRTSEQEREEQYMTTMKRKGEHIRICLQEQVQSIGIETGFDQYRFRHCALPELAYSEVDMTTTFLDKRMNAPLLVSSMTGGTGEASMINRRLAEAAESRGWAMGLGSMRAAIENEKLAETFVVRREAPTIPIIANIGAVQLNYGYGVDQCRRAVELAEADGLVLHLNSMQEVFQPEGDTDFRGLLARIGDVCRYAGVPVGIKEVGWGIDAKTATALIEAGAAFIDVAGAGGTSWSQVEKYRSSDPLRADAAAAFADWGIPTEECVREVRAALPDSYIIASGGLRNGVDAAKAIALGADLAGYGRSLLAGAAMKNDGVNELQKQMEQIEFELRTAMFGIGAGSLPELRSTASLVKR
ncbi:isopentenyl-diphosphate delta-isomerase [Paenibacillus baekrokdamisoli]|uniref:Isopentenyl-diphosphate delta-isomerase n=1 Tax=Paenibacillus baekrokdamisoli TaxID=1712516 RepID=A0A3G9ISV3_9BACL|nr:type 2 isopentenyl-diphosphate Delta-isomerase [Paenibacillus baekrokdamisoli]MBB3071049.1 isopentenyl-diphosphate delta-isomerase [Paenibacillus baekrokdamisoli]BBH21466.1 isopentenyl-diphosphate delta-isomerase [Paenibacillus baekrokdamisoli]